MGVPIDGLVKAVNLIPSEQRATPKGSVAGPAPDAPGSSAFGAYLILGALVFAIAATALYVLTTNTIKDNKAELARVEQEAETVTAQATTLQAFADFKQLSASRVATVKGLAAARFPWERTLDDVSRALPSDVFINSLDGSTTNESGGSGLRGAIQAPSIELNGCTSSQSSVAHLMSRLRDVRGVTRVSLAKSESVDTSVTAAAPAPLTPVDGNTPQMATEPCPKGAPPAFDMVIFFERAAISPNAAPNPGAPTGVSAVGPTGATGAPTGPTGATSTTTTP
jgi:Tfp pilus assembly protein PilN